MTDPGHIRDDERVATETALYPNAEPSPAEFELFVVELLQSAQSEVEELRVTLHDKIAGVDGRYDFDATITFRLAGMDFLVIVEAKRHAHPIKRELVQVLHDKLRSVGAQKAAMIATAPYQRGALEYAKTHGIALATVTEQRFTFQTRSGGRIGEADRDEPAGPPGFAAHAYAAGNAAGSTLVTLLSTPNDVVGQLLGVEPGSS